MIASTIGRVGSILRIIDRQTADKPGCGRISADDAAMLVDDVGGHLHEAGRLAGPRRPMQQVAAFEDVAARLGNLSRIPQNFVNSASTASVAVSGSRIRPSSVTSTRIRCSPILGWYCSCRSPPAVSALSRAPASTCRHSGSSGAA